MEHCRMEMSLIYAFKRNEKVQLISRVTLLKTEELSGGDSEVSTRSEEFRSLNEHDHLRTFPFTGLAFCGGFFCVCVIYSELQNTGCQEIRCRKTRSSGGEQVQLESLKRHGEFQSHPAPFFSTKG